MKTVYDMSTGQIVDNPSTIEQTHRQDCDAPATQLRLQPVATESRPERGIPPELVLADLNAFLEKMS